MSRWSPEFMRKVRLWNRIYKLMERDWSQSIVVINPPRGDGPTVTVPAVGASKRWKRLTGEGTG